MGLRQWWQDREDLQPQEVREQVVVAEPGALRAVTAKPQQQRRTKQDKEEAPYQRRGGL